MNINTTNRLVAGSIPAGPRIGDISAEDFQIHEISGIRLLATFFLAQFSELCL